MVYAMVIQQNEQMCITIYIAKCPKRTGWLPGTPLKKYERIYRQAFYDAAKKADPNWKIGKPIKAGALDDVTRESAETGKSPAQATLDTKI